MPVRLTEQQGALIDQVRRFALREVVPTAREAETNPHYGEALLAKLGKSTSSSLIDGADHSFHVPARSGRTDADVLSEVATTLAAWVDSLL